MNDNAFVALDFETANGKRTSICSIGMVKVVNHEIVETFYTL
ncbi:3'-5' exonuclease, partial [Staphylococcus arlettae]